MLVDEIEKAHPKVWNVLLQLLDADRLTDCQGNEVDFRNVIIITSNISAKNILLKRFASADKVRSMVNGDDIVREKVAACFFDAFFEGLETILKALSAGITL